MGMNTGREIVRRLAPRAKQTLIVSCSLVLSGAFWLFYAAPTFGAGQMMDGERDQLASPAKMAAPLKAGISRSPAEASGPSAKTGHGGSPLSPADELNRHLPGWLRFGGEYRARVEKGFTGKLFQAEDEDTYFLNLIR